MLPASELPLLAASGSAEFCSTSPYDIQSIHNALTLQICWPLSHLGSGQGAVKKVAWNQRYLLNLASISAYLAGHYTT